MAMRVCRVAVVGCPRAEITADPSFSGVGKSCLCNRFVRPQGYTESHNSFLGEEEWKEDPAYNGDHFIYWGATTKNLPDGSRVRFQVIEQTEFYDSSVKGRLQPFRISESYLARASSARVCTKSECKVAYRLHAEGAYATHPSSTMSMRSTQIYPNNNFSAKGEGVHAFVCVFDPTLEGAEMTRQKEFLTELLHNVMKNKKKVVVACSKCDAVDQNKLRQGSNLTTSNLKKPVPFIETSAREGVNIDEAFYALYGFGKKRKVNGKNHSMKRSNSQSGIYSYHEIVGLRKHDLSRAQDAYRKLLQRKVSKFSCVWSDVWPKLESEPDFSHLLELAGKEGKDIIKKQFCLRLIELKLIEAAEHFKMTSAKKKLAKDQLKSYQKYISDGLKEHPDFGQDSLYDYVYTPGGGPPVPPFPIQAPSIEDIPFQNPLDYVDGGSNSVSTSSSTPNTGTAFSYQTSDIGSPMPPSSTATPDYHLDTTAQHLTVQASESPPPIPRPPPSAVPMVPLTYPNSEPTSKRSTSLPRIATDQVLPPLPSRESSVSRSQSHLSSKEVLSEKHSHKSAEERLSNSMDCILKPDSASDSVDLNAQPYLNPLELKRVLGPLPPTPPAHSPGLPSRASSDAHRSMEYRSMRVPSKSRPVLPFVRKHQGHRRTKSNPNAVEEMVNSGSLPPPSAPLPPPPVPPRGNSQSPPSVVTIKPSVTGSTDSNASVLESSLDFGGLDRCSYIGSTASGTNEKEEDTISNVSGPFEEIDEELEDEEDTTANIRFTDTRSTGNLLSEQKSKTARPLRTHSQSVSSNPYASIGECNYTQMKPAPVSLKARARSTTYSHKISQQQQQQLVHEPVTRLHSNSVSSGSLNRTGKWMHSEATHDVGPSSLTSSPSQSPGTRKKKKKKTSMDMPVRPKSPLLERPLPPSPTKKLHNTARKISAAGASGNIYETIDEELVSKVKKGEVLEAATGWIPAVKPKHLASYDKIVRNFFSTPEVQQIWWRTVQSVVPAADLTEFPPPFFNVAFVEDSSGPTGKLNRRDNAPAIGGPRPPTSSSLPSAATDHSGLVSREEQEGVDGNSGRSSKGEGREEVELTRSRSDGDAAKPGNSSSSSSSSGGNASASVVGGGGSPPVRVVATATAMTGTLKKKKSRDDMIEYLNKQFNAGLSSDDSEDEEEEEEEGKEEEEEEESSGSSSDSDDSDSESADDKHPFFGLPAALPDHLDVKQPQVAVEQAKEEEEEKKEKKEGGGELKLSGSDSTDDDESDSQLMTGMLKVIRQSDSTKRGTGKILISDIGTDLDAFNSLENSMEASSNLQESQESQTSNENESEC